MTAKPGALIQFGGLAFVGVVCGFLAYGWSLDSANIVGHEVGHNWAAGHCHDLTPCNNMCGACFFIGPNTRDVILAHRNSRTCLDDVPASRAEHPPYVYPEGVVRPKNQFENLGPLVFDVLANDSDGNCDAIAIGSADATSTFGAALSVLKRAGRHGRDLLGYTPPADIFVGQDQAPYTVRDVTGRETPAALTVELRPLTSAAYWPLDETAGSVAHDASGNGNAAVAQGALPWSAGTIAGALLFDGSGTTLETSTADFEPPWTVSMWVQRKSSNATSSALMESSDGSLKLAQWLNSDKIGLTKFGVADLKFTLIAPLN